MSTLDTTLHETIQSVPEAVAAGYVDMSTGMLLAVRTVDSHPQEVLDMVSAATADLFQGKNVVAIEQMFKKARGLPADDHHYFQEIIVFSDNLLHVFLRAKRHTDHSLVIVTRKNANIGMVLTKSRMSLSSVEDSL
jgi:hypothetical protein